MMLVPLAGVAAADTSTGGPGGTGAPGTGISGLAKQPDNTPTAVGLLVQPIPHLSSPLPPGVLVLPQTPAVQNGFKGQGGPGPVP
jgi:hypothetical protein